MNIEFPTAFKDLTGKPPFPWQTKLFERFVEHRNDNIPRSCNLPTGLGKTSVIAIWLLALASAPMMMPRRLVYVVNRRTVVDQTTDEVEKLLPKLGTLPEHVRGLTISTLRGQFADNREWSADPSRPAVICGTVDMIGSRLLFSGYGVGFKGKPLHAGFLGQDVLLVHDEAHLEPAFQDLLIAIQAEQQRCNEFQKFRVMELSATARGSEDVFCLSDEDKANSEVKKRIEAKKAIHLVEIKDEKKLADEIARLALTYEGKKRAVLVFARRVDDIDKIVKLLPKGRVEQLTGTLRGKERDELVGKPIFQRFLPYAAEGEETVYLVCTSAGEVGVNISADHLVCDLSTFDSIAQRLGRVNRFGIRMDTEVYIVHPDQFDDKDIEHRREKTLQLLRKLSGDGSPKAIDLLPLEDRRAAFAPRPVTLPTSEILFDAWALTSIRDRLPGRPMVEPYLHGISSSELPEAHVAWREEVWELRREFETAKEREEFQHYAAELLDDYPLKPLELLRDNAGRVFDRLKKLKAPEDTPVWILSDDDSVQVTRLGAVIAGDKEDLNYKTILLPPSAGGLREGMLAGDSNVANDVADEWHDEQGFLRKRVWQGNVEPPDMKLVREVVFPNLEDVDAEPTKVWLWFVRPRVIDSPNSRGKVPYPLQRHLDDAKQAATEFVDRLKFAEPLRTAVIVAAWFHDLGKNRELWQRSIGNHDPKNPLAKSGGKCGRELSYYRHELGSLLDVRKQPEFTRLDNDMKELVLHLIGAHHGRARPHFSSDETFDPEASEQEVEDLASGVPERFARLQRKYGRWGLAYLESLVRAADILASKQADGGAK